MYEAQNRCAEAVLEPLQKIYVGFFHFAFLNKIWIFRHFVIFLFFRSFENFQNFCPLPTRKSGVELVWVCVELSQNNSLLLPIVTTLKFFLFGKENNGKSTIQKFVHWGVIMKTEIQDFEILKENSLHFCSENYGFFDIDPRLRSSFVTTAWLIRIFWFF